MPRMLGCVTPGRPIGSVFVERLPAVPSCWETSPTPLGPEASVEGPPRATSSPRSESCGGPGGPWAGEGPGARSASGVQARGVHVCGGSGAHADPDCPVLQAKAAKEAQEARRLQLRSVQYLERYVYLILFRAYLHLEKAGSWQRPFSTWMREVRGRPVPVCCLWGPGGWFPVERACCLLLCLRLLRSACTCRWRGSAQPAGLGACSAPGDPQLVAPGPQALGHILIAHHYFSPRLCPAG